MTALLALSAACWVTYATVGTGQIQASAALISPLPSPALPLPTVSVPPVLPTVPPKLPTPLPKLTPLPTILPTALPSILPTPLPSILPTPLPTPSLPVTLTPSPPLPSAPPIGVTPTPSSVATTPVAATSGGTGSGTSGGGPGSGIHIPFTPIFIQSPLDAALLTAVAVIPLMFGLWVLLFGRTWTEARRLRDAQVRLAIAHDLGLSPRELVSVSTQGLFKLREEAAFDEMTGVMRRAAGISALDREISRARRQKSPLAVAFIDFDGLKETNDKQGHKAGDELIRGLARILQSGLRGQDLVLRYGGDEFVCVLPDTVAEAARAKLSWVQTEAEKSGIHFSCGVAALERSDDVVSFLGRADTEMYAVKARQHKVRDLRLGVVGGGRPRRESA